MPLCQRAKPGWSLRLLLLPIGAHLAAGLTYSVGEAFDIYGAELRSWFHVTRIRVVTVLEGYSTRSLGWRKRSMRGRYPRLNVGRSFLGNQQRGREAFLRVALNAPKLCGRLDLFGC